MKWLTAVAASLVTLSAPAVASAADVTLSADEVRSLVTEAAAVRRALHAEVHAKEPRSGDFVNVTVFGGLPPPDRFTLYLVPIGAKQFRAEFVIQDRVFQGPPKPTRRTSFIISQEPARKIASLLENRGLWRERNGVDGQCTDQPVVALELVWKGRRRDAVRLGCAPSDLTGSLIDAALSQSEKH